MNNDKNTNMSPVQNINVPQSDIEIHSEEEILVTEITTPVSPKVDIDAAEIVDIIIDEAFPYASPTSDTNHSLLHGRDLPDQHPISAITDLEDELRDIKAVKPVYSSSNGLSEFRKWRDENPNGENRSGYFVTIVDGDKIEKCDTLRNVYGVTVSASGFVGNQNDFDKSDDYTYAMVGIVGAVRVRTDGTARDGEYVIPNKLGEATFSENGYGYKVLSQGSYPSYNYVTIAIAPQSGVMGGSGSGTGSGEFNDIIVEIDGIKDTVGNLQVKIDGAMSSDEVQDIINENLADLTQKVENANNIAQTASGTAQSAQAQASQAASVATQAQQAAQSAAREAIDTAKEAASGAQSAIDIANKALEDLAKTSDSITLIQTTTDENKAAIEQHAKLITEQGEGLATIQQAVTEYESTIDSAVVQIGEQGSSIASLKLQAAQNDAVVQHLVSHVDKYSVGEYSLSYGLTHEEAKDVLTSEHIYIPTYDHEELMDGNPNGATNFEHNYVYTWDATNGQWKKSDKPISTATTYQDGTANGDLWFCWQDVERPDENNAVVDTYIGGTLYRWFDNKWVAVATNTDNHQGRILTSVKQTAESIRSDVVDLQGNLTSVVQDITGLSTTVKANSEGISKNTEDITAVNVRANEINATIARVETETKEGIATVNQAMSSVQMGVEDNTNAIALINTGRYHVSFWSEIGNIPEVPEGEHKYSTMPVWDDELGQFVFNEDFVDDESGTYYFDSNDKTKYCKLTKNGYEYYTIGNQVTSSLNQRIDDTEAGLDLLTEYVDEQNGELKESVAVIGLKADANAASINSVTSYYYHTLLSISETEIPVIDGERRYNNKPTWDAAEGKYKFDIADRAEDGAYYLADGEGSTYCKVVTAGDGSTLYEIYGLAGSYMAAIQQGADENGGYIQSIVMDIERYNVGQYSPSYGMSYDDAVISVPKGTMYVPTIAHSENLIPDERLGTDQVGVDQLNAGTLEDRETKQDVIQLTTPPFDALEVDSMQTYDFEVGDTQTYSHEWDGTGWQKSDPVSLKQEYYNCDDNPDEPKLWYCTKDVSNTQEVIAGKGGVYKQGTLYAWHGGRWFAVATISDSLLSRSLSLVRQTANSYSIELRNMQGDFSQYKQTVTEIGMLVSGADGSSGSLNITKEGIVGEVYNRTGNSATLKAQADATQAVLDLAISGLYHKLEQPLTDNVPSPSSGNRYSARPTWVASLGKFVFYESTKADDGAYYFFDDDETHYCKVVGDQYEVYTIGTLSTASTDAHITEEFANINTLAYYGDDETSTIAGLRNLALEGKAQVQLLASLDNSKLVRVVDVHGYTVPEGTKRYANRPTYQDGSYTFDEQAENANGDYFLIDSTHFGKLITNAKGGCYGYEMYEYDSSSTAGLVSTVLNNQAKVGMIVDSNGVMGKVVVEAINGQSEATILADKVNLKGYVTVTSLSDSSTTTINGAEICSGVIKSNNYITGTSPYSSTGTYIDLSDGSISSKNFAIDDSGNLHLKGDISATNACLKGGLKVGNTDGSTYNFIVEPDGDVTVKGILDATDIKIGGTSILEGNKIKSNYLDLGNIQLDGDNGNITLTGSIKISGNIEWGTSNSPTLVLYARTSLSAPTSTYASYSSTSSTNWHKTYNSTYDFYASYTYDGGKTWTNAIKIRGEDGADGEDGSDGSDAELTDQAIFDMLTSNGTKFGIFNGSGADSLYVNASYIRSGAIDADLITTGTLDASIITLDGKDDDGYSYGLYPKSGTTGNDSTSGYKLVSASSLYDPVGSGEVFVSNAGVKMSVEDWQGRSNEFYVSVGQIYASDTIEEGSDARIKKNIQYNIDKYADFFMSLKPASYQMLHKNSDKIYIGYIAQDVQDALLDNGLSIDDFHGLNQQHSDTPNSYGLTDMYTLGYTEFIALNTHMIQKLYARIDELETKLNNISAEKE